MKPSPRIPVLAAALSLFVPGLGQLYSGRIARALAFAFFGFLFIFALPQTIATGDLFITLGFELLTGSVFTLLVVVDAWWVAKKAPDDYQKDENNRLSTYLWFTLLTVFCAGYMALAEIKRLQDEFQTFRMASHSMAPLLIENDLIYVKKRNFLAAPPVRGELVVYQSPEAPETRWVSRVIGLPGDFISIQNGKLFVNRKAALVSNSPAIESLSNFSYEVLGMDQLEDLSEFEVPAGCVFLLCDNRNRSKDSRHFGSIYLAMIEGTLKHRYWPRNRAGKLNVPATR